VCPQNRGNLTLSFGLRCPSLPPPGCPQGTIRCKIQTSLTRGTRGGLLIKEKRLLTCILHCSPLERRQAGGLEWHPAFLSHQRRPRGRKISRSRCPSPAFLLYVFRLCRASCSIGCAETTHEVRPQGARLDAEREFASGLTAEG
jgi:hypothetical protein